MTAASVFPVDTSPSGRRVVRELDRVVELRRAPLLVYIARGQPVQNAFVESLNGRLRDECLNPHVFQGLPAAWSRTDHNQNGFGL